MCAASRRGGGRRFRAGYGNETISNTSFATKRPSAGSASTSSIIPSTGNWTERIRNRGNQGPMMVRATRRGAPRGRPIRRGHDSGRRAARPGGNHKGCPYIGRRGRRLQIANHGGKGPSSSRAPVGAPLVGAQPDTPMTAGIGHPSRCGGSVRTVRRPESCGGPPRLLRNRCRC